MLKYRQIPNVPIKIDDAKNMIKAYGPDVHALRGKTVRWKPSHVPSGQRLEVPEPIIRAHSRVTLCSDIFFVDGIIFLLAVSRNIRHVFVDVLESRAMVTRVLPLIKHCCNKYALQGFKVTEFLADPEFEPLRAELLKPENTAASMYPYVLRKRTNLTPNVISAPLRIEIVPLSQVYHINTILKN